MYQLRDWLADFEWVLASEVKFHQEGESLPPGYLEAHFEERYKSNPDFYRRRLCAAIAYEKKYLDEFDEPPIAISGQGRTAVGRPLILALYQLYARCPDNMIHHEPDPKFVLDLARKQVEGGES